MKIILSILFFSLFIIILNDPCKYRLENGTETDSDKSDPLDGITGDENEKKQKCFSLSHSDIFENQCCYANGKCFEKEVNIDAANCPQNSIIYNNCGMAGIYQPKTAATCTEISLVQGYCCYANFTDGSSACIRTKELNKDKNSATDDMSKYLNKVKDSVKLSNEFTFDKVQCKGYYLKFYMIFLILLIISL